MNGKWAVALALAIGGAVAYLVKGGSKFFMQGTIQFWKRNEAAALKTFLGKVHLQETSTARMWRVMPGIPAGKQNALVDIRAMALRASLVVSTINLLDSGNQPRTVGEVTTAEAMVLVTGPEVAVLPTDLLLN